MGIIKKRNIFIGAIILIIIWLLYVYKFRKFEDPRLTIMYNNRSFPNAKLSTNFILGKTPNFYDEQFEEFSLKNTDKYNLININWIKLPDHYNHILLHDKLNNKEYILKNNDSLFYHFLYVNGYTKGLSSQIDLRTFNHYLRLTKTKGKEKIISRFCNLFNEYEKGDSILVDNSSFRIIDKGLVEVYENISTGSDKKDTVIINREEGIEGFKRGEIYYIWLKNHGLHKFDFLIDHDSLEYVNDQFLGNTGEEEWK